MRRNRVQHRDPATPVTSVLPEVDPALRDAPDADRIVEEMVDRLRSSLRGLVALDEYGRPVPWRQVVRIALGPALLQLHERDGDLEHVIELPTDDLGARADSVAAGVEAPDRVLAADAARGAPDGIARGGKVRGRHYRPE